MTRRIQITLLSLLMSVCAMASNTSVKNSDGVDIWYIFNSSTKTARVTYRGNSGTSYTNEYTGNVVIPSTVTYEGEKYSVTSIGDYAFRSCTSLTSIILPEGVTSIGEDAFYGCYSLTSITLPESLTSIGDDAFASCSALTSITLPESLTSIGDDAFEDCYSLTSITLPESLTSIGNSAFFDCYKLYEVYNKSDLTITAGRTYYGRVAYYAKNVYTDSEGESKLKTVGDYIFYVDGEDIELIAYTGSETSITLPSDYEGKNYNIGDYAFYECDALTSITIPEGVTSIGDYAFCYCEALTSITLPESVTSIGNSAFEECYALTSITLPEGVTSIGNSAFYDCSALTSITLPESLTSIGDYAFYRCYRLYEVYNKSDLTITAGNSDNGYVASYAKNVYSEGESKLKTVGDYIFYVDGEDIELIAYTGDETSITLPSDYEGKNYKIGDYAFYSCYALTSITLPEGLTSIGDDAFDYCSALTSITIPESVTSIGDYAFTDCSALTELNYNGTIADWCGISFGNYSANPLYSAKHLYIDGEEVKDLVIPSGVTAIKDYAFYNCDGLTSITIPEGVTSIGYEAFYSCSSLTSITLPESLTSIGDDAFRSCTALTSITLPKSLTSIGDYAFYHCYSLTSITLPESLTSIGNNAFYHCYKLYEVYNKSDLTITAGSKDNGYVAYYAKNVYTDSEGESKLKTVGDYIFYVDGEDIELIAYTGSETSITLPSDYEGKNYNIGGYAFFNCDALTSITSKNATPPTIGGSGTFYNVDKSIPVYVPKSSVDAYKSAVYWKDFTNIVGKYYIVDIEAENGTVEGAGAYEENAEATLTATPAEGYKFVKWSDGVTDNPRTVVVTSDMTFTADIQKCWTVYATAENGDISGVGVYLENEEATLTVTPAEGYKFVQWSDGVTDNPRTIVVTSDLTLTAEFEIDVTPISDIQTSDVKVRLIGNEIAVEGADDYTVYSISGQNLGKAESVERGIYIVVANGKRCKVIAK